MDSGYIVIFRNADGHIYPSGIVHKTREKAVQAFQRGDKKGEPLAITIIAWDEEAPVL